MAYTLDQAKEKVTGYTTPKYGRGPNSDSEWNTIANGINWQDGVDDNELNQAYGNADSLAASYGVQPAAGSTPAPTAPQAPAAPQTPVSPQYAVPVPKNVQGTIGNLFQQQPASPVQTAYSEQLLNLMNESSQPVSLADPNLSQQSETYRASRQRGTERQRSALAERAAQTGTSGAGGFDTAVGNLYGDESRDIAGNDAELVRGEMTARRAQMMQALTLAQQTGNADAARQLQTQLALLDASLNQSQFTDELGFRNSALTQQGKLGQGDLALRLLALLTGNQFNYDQLGSQNAFNLADLNQRGIQNFLNGF